MNLRCSPKFECKVDPVFCGLFLCAKDSQAVKQQTFGYPESMSNKLTIFANGNQLFAQTSKIKNNNKKELRIANPLRKDGKQNKSRILQINLICSKYQ